MTNLQAKDFDEFFQALYPFVPMSWQTELAAAACVGEWPDCVSVPTGAGKTSTIDIAVFALAVQANLPPEKRNAPMRTFLVVDRRTVVSEAFHRASQLQKKLAEATDGVLKRVADKLRSYSGSTSSSEPLSVVELRGGIYRDPSWCNSLTQPMIVTSTVDQVGSRLLFRGYGVSNSSRPIQAAAVAHDSLLILDEAHISRAFSETLAYVKAYQRKPWATNPMPLPLRIVEMTATPSTGSSVKKLEITQAELDDPSTHIGRIVNTSKIAKLEIAEKASGSKAPKQIAAVLAKQAMESVGIGVESPDGTTDKPLKVVGVLCNMVATAKEVVSLLLKNKLVSNDDVYLIIGAMRPIDRDVQTDKLRDLISTGTDRSAIDQPMFVVATQCIEVGADYDFDVLITEAAPLDALVQRFGRLNRGGRPINSIAQIVMRGDLIKAEAELDNDDEAFKFADPIYGNATSRTWNWLQEVAVDDAVDFGIATLKKRMATINAERRRKLSTESTSAPVLLPAHLDLLCQTSFNPWPDPDVALWLHGPQRNDPDIQVCWRADLLPPTRPIADSDVVTLSLEGLRIEQRNTELVHAISLCPPSSAECLSIPLRRVIAWLTSIVKQKKTEIDTSGDVSQIAEGEEHEGQLIPFSFRPIAWRGIDKSVLIANLRDIRPGDTLVFSPIVGGWTELGYLPDFNDWSPSDSEGNPLHDTLHALNPYHQSLVKVRADVLQKLARIDCGSIAFEQSRRRPILRLHPSLIFESASRKLFTKMHEQGSEFKITRTELKAFIESLSDNLKSSFVDVLPSEMKLEFYLDRVGQSRVGLVVSGPSCPTHDVLLSDDDGSDLYSQVMADQTILLADHLEHVRAETERATKQLPLGPVTATLLRSAEVHDWGKADPRFQAMLLGGDLYDASWSDDLYAKSAKMPTSAIESRQVHEIAELPSYFRHELLSMSLVEFHASRFEQVEDWDLLLHLIASHHGYARPWVPVCNDDSPPPVSLERIGIVDILLTEHHRKSICHHRIDSGIPRRFWNITRKYGWWGVAYLEAILRLADRRASQIESQLQSARLLGSESAQLVGVGGES